YARPAVPPAVRLRPEHPEAALRVVPQARVVRADHSGRIDYELGSRPSLAAVAAGDKDDVVDSAFARRILPAGVPDGPKPAVRRAFDAGNALKETHVIRVLAAGGRVDRRRGEGGIVRGSSRLAERQSEQHGEGSWKREVFRHGVSPYSRTPPS